MEGEEGGGGEQEQAIGEKHIFEQGRRQGAGGVRWRTSVRGEEEIRLGSGKRKLRVGRTQHLFIPISGSRLAGYPCRIILWCASGILLPVAH